MISRLRPRITYANVVSSLCLFILLGGGAYAATSHLAKNSVGSKQIKKNAVTSAKVKNGTLKAADAKKGQFALPSDLSRYLTLGGTAQDSVELQGIRASGFVRGGGHLLRDTTSATSDTDLVDVPGGTIRMSCDSSGFDFFFHRADGYANEVDIFETRITSGINPEVSRRADNPGSLQLLDPTKNGREAMFDISTPAGQAQVTAFGTFNNSTDTCTAAASGNSNP